MINGDFIFPKRTGAIIALSFLQFGNLSAQERPNIIMILADDMGYSDIGCYGSEIETPHIDNLASQGVRMPQFYNTSRSCPTRASMEKWPLQRGFERFPVLRILRRFTMGIRTSLSG